MALLYNLDIGSTYNFALYGSAILGSGYSAAKVTGLLDYSSAMQISDVAALHASVYPDLPSGTPSDASLLTYVKIVTSSGSTSVLALNWISSQPTQVTSTTITVTIYNTSLTKLPAIQAMLNANGFTSFALNAT